MRLIGLLLVASVRAQLAPLGPGDLGLGPEMGPEMAGLPPFLMPLPGLPPTGSAVEGDPIVEKDILMPGQQQYVVVELGDIVFKRFQCPLTATKGGPADVIITLSMTSIHADPLMIVTLKGARMPKNIGDNDATSLDQWKEDAPGNHHVKVARVGPEGGLVGILNLEHFGGGEALTALLEIKCSQILVFDVMFWDFLREDYMCPNGLSALTQSQAQCSARGRCSKHGECVCDNGFAGIACEHKNMEVDVSRSGPVDITVAPGHYQYFRIRIPRNFKGGYLKVHLKADKPLIVIVKKDKLPTRNDFEESNFDDWIKQNGISNVKYKVLPGGADEVIIFEPEPQMSRRLAANRACPKDQSVPGPDFGGDPKCSMSGQCGDDCLECTRCRHRNDPSGPLKEQCDNRCASCHGKYCTDMLTNCAEQVDCFGAAAFECDVACGDCMPCLESAESTPWNNVCAQMDCSCCTNCFSVEAKCVRQKRLAKEKPVYVYVGIYNHHKFYNTKPATKAEVDIELEEDPAFTQVDIPKSWTADLYNPFMSMRHIDQTQRDIYPAEEKFMYHFSLASESTFNTQKVTVNLFNKRLTLLHIECRSGATLLVSFLNNPGVVHVLTSTEGAPKTLFDFNRLAIAKSETEIQIFGSKSVSRHPSENSAAEPSHLWVALFGGTDAKLTIKISSSGGLKPRREPRTGSNTAIRAGSTVPVVSGPSSALGVTGTLPPSDETTSGGSPSFTTCLFLLCCCGSMTYVCSRTRVGDAIRREGLLATLSDLSSMVRRPRRHEATQSLTGPQRENSLTSYPANDTPIDESTEDAYLHRGGFGDDGI